MSRKHNCFQIENILVMTATEATMAKKPRYNAFQGGYGAHGKRKYDRNAAKRQFRKELAW